MFATYCAFATAVLAWWQHCGRINIGWLYVFLPLWAPLVACAVGGAVIAVFLGIPAMLEALDRRLPLDDCNPTDLDK